MTLFNAIYRRLTANPTIAEIVDDRVWDELAEDPTAPFVVIGIEEETDEAIHAKTAPHYTVTVTCVGRNKVDRNALAAAVQASLNRQAWTMQNVQVFSALLLDTDNQTVSDGGDGNALYATTDQTYNFIASQ